MAIKLNSLKADMRRINDGEWVTIDELPDGDGGFVQFKVRGNAYGPYQTDLSNVRMRWSRKYESKQLATPPEVLSRDLSHLYAKHLLLDWKGFDEPYSMELAEEMLNSTGEFFNHVQYAVNYVSRTDAELVEDMSKNSQPSSGGTSKTVKLQATG